MPPLISPPSPTLWMESFDELRPERWREVEVHRQTRYQVVTLDGRRCLQAHSRAGASILLSQLRFNPNTYRWLSWRWRVDQLVEGEALHRKGGSDAAARVYVYFETKALPWQKRNLDYLWSAALPAGSVLESAYSSESKIIVAESGKERLGQWLAVERNLVDDHRRCFGADPPPVVAVGLMSDTDNTEGEALAYFDDLRISRLPASTSQR
ncbi:MAG: DUF3047 domain-containing protein [Candidatus Omnitrophica bacterium]|nr:DUF3047 domain-containing protein [Candidatus Omnitrophota bacterium]MBI3021020.1 DUF3047 domain-containing protein [Candidatus Omnitrophota bacterium]MBI3083250.1 DUF3047 domain-containing protein [Candidatus Omnitrophota bacterium]